jgi:hypothetical protein
MTNFTHYWTATTLAAQRAISRPGERLEHCAGNLFRARHVRHGDRVYIVSFSRRDLRLVARMTVDRIVSESEAYRILQPSYGLWEADEHVLALPGSDTEIHFDLLVPAKSVAAIRFLGADGTSNPPAVNRNGNVDPQTFRGVREITPSTAAAFDRLLGA